MKDMAVFFTLKNGPSDEKKIRKTCQYETSDQGKKPDTSKGFVAATVNFILHLGGALPNAEKCQSFEQALEPFQTLGCRLSECQNQDYIRALMKNLSLALVIFLSLSCTRHEKPNLEDRYQVIQSRIDQKKYAEAESELSAILEQDPKNERARMILASLYVHKAGITLKDYFLLEKLSHLEENPSFEMIKLEKLEKLELPADVDSKKALDFLKRINEIAGRAVEISQKFEQVTLVSELGASDLYRALSEMEKIGKPQNGNALYRGVIKLFYFKYLWAKGKFLKFGDRKFCVEKIGGLEDRMSEFHRYLLGMFSDVAKGFPKSREAFEVQIQDLDKGFLEVEKFLAQVKDASQTVEATLAKTILKEPLEGWKCEF